MRILIADQFSELGGAQRGLLELLPAILEQGWTCSLAVPGRGPLRIRAEELGIRCDDIACGPFGCGYKSLSDLARFGTQFPRLRSQFRTLIDDFKPDVFYVNAPRLVPAACALGPHAPPMVFHVHSYLKQRYAAALTGYSLQRARPSIIANCHFVLEPLKSYLNGSAVEVIYNGVNDCTLSVSQRALSRIGIIGRICPEKGQKVLVEAARLLEKRLPGLSYVICGGTQFSDENAEAYCRELRQLSGGLPVEFAGWRDDVGNVLHSLDLLVVASMPMAEASTRVIPEAYSAGVPVLASDLPGIREILTDGVTGFLFEPANAHALARRIRQLVEAPPDMLSAATANARRLFEERFSIAAYQRRMIGSLERVGARALA
jgi:glycosyltransferase involved in cell wall biosynthesis